MHNSPYQDKMSNDGLFLKALASKAPQFPNLICANLGNRLADGETLVRMGSLALNAPALEEQKLEQIAALPLGSRIKPGPWSDQIVLIRTRPISLLSPREKLSFEIAPMALAGLTSKTTQRTSPGNSRRRYSNVSFLSHRNWRARLG